MDPGFAPEFTPELVVEREDRRAGAAGTAPAVLRDLIAAGLVTHEAIGDPARLGAEPAALRALCALVEGPVYRLEPFHYAFAVRAGDLGGDLGGALAGRAVPERTAALAAALAATLGPEAVWLGATGLADEAAEASEARSDLRSGPLPDVMPEAALVVLRAQHAAVAEGLAAADPDLRAVIDARFALEAARRGADLAAALGIATAAEAGAASAALDGRLAAIESRLEALLDAQARAAAAPARATEAFELQAFEARAFEARLGLALAEFLARLERRGAGAGSVA